ncbi:hypothetical protein ACNOYE_05610 [Nannocystaceae bacterium ST9]
MLPRRRSLASLVSLALLLATACTSDAPASLRAGAGESETSETDTGDELPTDFTPTCTDAAIHRLPATLRGSLRPLVETIAFDVPPIGLDCALGEGGPIGFVRVEVPIRADLRIHARGGQVIPRVATLQAGCASEALDRDRLLACVDALPVVVEDLRPGTELLLAIGAAVDDPALATPTPAPGVFDPLEVELELTLRAVIEEGERCDAGLGRCETGTLCLSAIEAELAVDRCRRPEAESCADPGELALLPPGETLVLAIDTSEAHGDAHAHSCTGWRRPERVHRLRWPAGAEISPQARLEIVADDPRVGLALRAPDCLPDHAQGCAPPDLEAGPHTLIVGEGQLPSWAAQGVEALLFVELPRDEAAAIFSVSLRITEP